MDELGSPEIAINDLLAYPIDNLCSSDIEVDDLLSCPLTSSADLALRLMT